MRAHEMPIEIPDMLRLSAEDGTAALELHFRRWKADGQQWLADPHRARLVRTRAEIVAARRP